MQFTDPHPTLTLILSIWAGVGPLVGLLVGHYLIRSWQHKQWLLDSRKQEFRELLSALGNLNSVLIELSIAKPSGLKAPYDEWMAAQRIAHNAIMDRIFIRSDITKLNVSKRFLNIDCKEEHFDESIAAMARLIKDLASAAQKA